MACVAKLYCVTRSSIVHRCIRTAKHFLLFLTPTNVSYSMRISNFFGIENESAELCVVIREGIQDSLKNTSQAVTEVLHGLSRSLHDMISCAEK